MTKKTPHRMTLAEHNALLKKEGRYQALLDAQAAEDAKRLERIALLRKAQAPIVADLKAAGFDFESVWQMANSGEPYADALPILLDHLERSYPEDLRLILGEALALPEARFTWDRILNLYRKETTKGGKDGLASALSEIADDELLDDVIELVRDPSHGSSRLLLLSALTKSKRPDAREVLEEMASDPDLKKEIRFLRKIEGRCKK